MQLTNDLEIYSSRILNYSVEQLYQAFANPEYLKLWWGPDGFTNTIHEFDLKPGGTWRLTMHGPEKGNYENVSVFTNIQPYKLIAWKRISQPLFNMEVGFNKINDTKSSISFKMIFETTEECNKMKAFVVPKNEENFDRLYTVLKQMQ